MNIIIDTKLIHFKLLKYLKTILNIMKILQCKNYTSSIYSEIFQVKSFL